MDSFICRFVSKPFRTSLLVTLIGLSVFFSPLAWATDCKKAKAPSEKTICSDLELKELDEILNKEYSKVISTVSPGKRIRTIEKAQKKWIQKRNQTCKKDIPCLKRFLTQRINEIEKMAHQQDETASDQQIILHCLQEEETLKPRPASELFSVYQELKKLAEKPKAHKAHLPITDASGHEQIGRTSTALDLDYLKKRETSLKDGYLFIADINNDQQNEYIIILPGEGKDEHSKLFVLQKLNHQFIYMGEPPRPPDSGDGPWYFSINKNTKTHSPEFLTQACDKIYMNFFTKTLGKETYLWENGINQPIQLSTQLNPIKD